MSVAKGFAVLMVAAAAGVAGGAVLMPPERPDVRKNWDRIAEMSPSERTRLDQKFRAYQALTPEAQSRLRTLYRALEQDRQTKNGLNTSAMNDYVAWISTIPAASREQLSATTDPAERITAMRTILSEQQARKTPELAEMSGPLKISRAELADVISIVEEHVRPTLSSDDEATLEGLKSRPAVYRDAFIVTKLSSKFPAQPDPATLPPPWSQGLFDDLTRRAQNPGIRMMVQQAMQMPRGRWGMAVGLNWRLLNAVRLELRRELMTRKAGESELESHFLSLGQAEQDRLSRLSADDFRSALRMSFFGKTESVLRDFRTEYDRFDEITKRWAPFQRRPDGPPGRPEGMGRPDGFGPGDRRPGRGEFGPPDGPRGEFRGGERDRFRPDDRRPPGENGPPPRSEDRRQND
ncbi:DUF3106 domain-containing protein [Planctomyces sp. SH-PL14]|uniref:DUF3106 domain-containing protein n=1 Tax=Planctomyces sp. SH-PL14 TaxID=1632864 RepID=UPI00078C293D|nr:DUF3106 domain-containing protein [Planctomyces sp. SH-PL14]AMV21469.1 hypothetical protein VT03_26435 [Planctomyces sp. SH-PL14]